MKSLTLSVVFVSALVTLTQAGQGPPNAMQAGPVLPPGLSYSAPFQWEIRTTNSESLNRLLTELRRDIEAAAPALAMIGENTDNAAPGGQRLAADSSIAEYASGNTVLLAKDLSTLLSADLSVNLGQNVATSLAMLTSVPWSTWGNGPGMVLVNSNGTVIAVPTFPPRTAWGNGPGLVVTTPGGAVFSIVPGPAPVANDKADAMREALRQLSIVQDGLDRVLRFLETNAVPPALGPSPVYLRPGGSDELLTARSVRR